MPVIFAICKSLSFVFSNSRRRILNSRPFGVVIGGVTLGLVAIYLFFTDARFMLALAAISIALYVLERAGAIKQGPVTALARYFLAVSLFIAIPVGLIFLFRM